MVDHNNSLLVAALSKKDRLSLAKPKTYNSVRCRLGDNAVWEHLLSNPAHAAHVRDLEIQREDWVGRGVMDEEKLFLEERRKLIQGITIPDKFTREEVVHSELRLMQAIRLMVNLESFTWDRWVPEVNHGEEIQTTEHHLHYETYREDIWTALRGNANLKKLVVVDLGRAILRPTDIPMDVRSIFSSTIFTLRNLTYLDLKMFYSPADEMEGSYDEYEDDDDDDEELIAGRVKWERFHDLLSRCPNIESLSLAIYDHDFYYKYGGNPYTNITPIVSRLMGHWHHLSTLKLRDVVVSDAIMTTFLNTHPNLRTLSMSLSLEDDLPDLPFDAENYITDLSRNEILSNIESLHISPPRALRPVLRSLKRPSPLLHSLGTLEPCDWNASEELHTDENYVSSLDDVWGYGSPSPIEAQDASPGGSRELSNLFSGISNVRSLVVTDVKDLRQLDKLVRATPELETIVFTNSFGYLASHRAPHTELISHLSHWSRLTTLYGLSLWPSPDDCELDVSSESALSIARDIITHCPLLQHVSWIDGTPLTIVNKDRILRLELQI